MILAKTVKRWQMRRATAGWRPWTELPEGYAWRAWSIADVDTHAAVMQASFAGTVDADLFVNLSNLTGCRLLMRSMTDLERFCPSATWLVTWGGVAVAGIQGIVDGDGEGWIQNVCVTPEHRRRGLGRGLVAQTMHGFHAAGVASVRLEVTAANLAAAGLYRRLGFKTYSILYREADRLVRPRPTA
jgi:ribosomal protein S18 acetylase RimI-like enzyme